MSSTKFIFVTGGVISGIGKGITFASLGRILKNRGYKVFAMKLDPYLNYDPGTMSPFQHGEVFVTQDGAETDLDLGHYERFIDVELSATSSVTSGRVYKKILNQERKGLYGGSTVQVIPHVTNEIKNYIKRAASESGADIVMVEVGGTVGDIESEPFLEAIRQMRMEEGYDSTFYIHLTLVPFIDTSEEYKTKPTQHSVKTLRSIGISPDLIILRSKGMLSSEIKEKVALFCDIRKENVISVPDLKNIYELPLVLEDQHLDQAVARHFKFDDRISDMSKWRDMVKRMDEVTEKVKIGLIGKYVKLHDAYLSVSCALQHASYALNRKVEIKWIESESITKDNVAKKLEGLDGLIIPGGFGIRGIDGMVEAARCARENNIPLLGICLGLQIIAIEFARNILGYSDATSIEFNQETTHPVIHYLSDQYDGIDLGGTMRLGNSKLVLKDKTKTKDLYKLNETLERHRHRYEFNSLYKNEYEKNGLIEAGFNPERNLTEVFELKNHPFYIGCQFHPEFKSRPDRPHPLFLGLIEESIKASNNS